MKLSATSALIVAMIVGFIVVWSPGTTLFVTQWMACDGGAAKPWSYLTYPFFGFDLGIGLLFLMFEWAWFYFIGTRIESSVGWKKFLVIFFAYAAASGILVVVPMKLITGMALFTGAWLPVSALTCFWAAQNPTYQICWMGVIRMAAKWLALLTAVIDFLYFGYGMPVVGLMAATSCGLAYLHGSGFKLVPRKTTVTSGRGQRSQTQKEFEGFIDKVRSREKEREERDRLRRLFESSVEDGGEGPNEPKA